MEQRYLVEQWVVAEAERRDVEDLKRRRIEFYPCVTIVMLEQRRWLSLIIQILKGQFCTR
jgi:hypothetical protein